MFGFICFVHNKSMIPIEPS